VFPTAFFPQAAFPGAFFPPGGVTIAVVSAQRAVYLWDERIEVDEEREAFLIILAASDD